MKNILIRNGNEIEVNIKYGCESAHKGYGSEPDQPPYIYIESVISVDDGYEYGDEITEEEEEEFIEQAEKYELDLKDYHLEQRYAIKNNL